MELYDLRHNTISGAAGAAIENTGWGGLTLTALDAFCGSRGSGIQA